MLWVLFRHLGVASESGVWGEGKDRVILCTNKNVKIQSYHCSTGKICSYESVNTTPVQAPLGCCWQELPGGRVGRPGPGSLLPMWTLLQILVAWKDGFFIGLLFGWLIDWRVCWSAALLVGQLVKLMTSLAVVSYAMVMHVDIPRPQSSCWQHIASFQSLA